MKEIAFILTLVVGLFSCKQAQENKTLSDLYGSYTGQLPCADCEGIVYQLTLKDDNTYTLNSTYLGREPNNKRTETGKYTFKEDIVHLGSNGKESMYLFDKGSLEKLDQNGKKIISKLNYKLARKK